jgi:hypothetical protein
MKTDLYDQENSIKQILASKTEQKQQKQQQQQNDVINNKDTEVHGSSGSNVDDSDDNNKNDNSNNEIVTFWDSDINTYVTYRINNSNLKKYYLGRGLSIEEADEVVNSFALINALVLTIPFSILASYSDSFWDWLNENNDQCDGNSYQKVADLLLNTLYATAYSSMTSLIIAILYYILRPKNKEYFKIWYGHAKWAIFIMFFMTATGIIIIIIIMIIIICIIITIIIITIIIIIIVMIIVIIILIITIIIMIIIICIIIIKVIIICIIIIIIITPIIIIILIITIIINMTLST